MSVKISKVIYFTIFIIPMVQGPLLSTFFWKPQVQVRFGPEIPPDSDELRQNIVLIEGYYVGLTIMAITEGFNDGKKFKHLSPLSAPFYTNAYRWFLRYIDSLPEWMSKGNSHYTATHKVWKKRYTFMDSFMPDWLKKVFFFVNSDEWQKEEREYKKFTSYAERAFGQHYVYQVNRTVESQLHLSDLERSDLSVHGGK